MCGAQLGKVIKAGEKRAVVDFEGLSYEVRSGLVDVKEGDNVLVHAGIIIQKVTEKDARELSETKALMEE